MADVKITPANKTIEFIETIGTLLMSSTGTCLTIGNTSATYLDRLKITGIGDAELFKVSEGSITLGTNLLPDLTDTRSIGSSVKWFKDQFVSQINATIFAEQTISLVGGWMVIGKNQVKLPAVTAVQTQIDFGTLMYPGDFIVIKAHDASNTIKTEYMQIGSLVSGTLYNVTRDVAAMHGTDPVWTDGTPGLVLGTTGDGRIEFNAYDTPRISVLTQGATYNAQTEVIRLGDLNGIGGISGQKFGIYIGTANNHMRYESTGDELVVTGKINASSGYIGGVASGWNISSDLVKSANDSVLLSTNSANNGSSGTAILGNYYDTYWGLWAKDGGFAGTPDNSVVNLREAGLFVKGSKFKAANFNGTNQYMQIALPSEMITNGTFEAGTNTFSWIPDANFTVTYNDTEVGKTGSYCMKIVTSIAGSYYSIYKPSLLTIGKKYKLKMRYKSTCSISFVYNTNGNNVFSATSEWNTISFVFTANGVDFGIQQYSAAAGSTIWIDDISIKEDQGFDLNKDQEQILNSKNWNFERTLITNYTTDFSTSTAWALYDSTITGNQLVVNKATVGTFAVINLGITTGKRYVVKFDISEYTSGEMSVILGGYNGSPSYYSGVGSYSYEMSATYPLTDAGFYLYAVGSFVGKIDNLFVYEIPNLVTNGNNTSDYFYSTRATYTYNSGTDDTTLTATDVTGEVRIGYVYGTGKKYKFSFQAKSSTITSFALYMGTFSVNPGIAATYQTFEGTFDSSFYLAVGASANGQTVDFKNFHIYEISEWTPSFLISGNNHYATVSLLDKYSGTQSMRMTASGAGRGAELITNGNFSSHSAGIGTDWAQGYPQTNSIVTGNGFSGNAQRVYHSGTDGSTLRQPGCVLTSGKTYEISFYYRFNKTVSDLRFGTDNIYTVFTIDASNTGNAVFYKRQFTCTNTDYFALSLPSSNLGAWYEISNVTIKEVLGEVVLPYANLESCVAGKKYTLEGYAKLDPASLSYGSNKVVNCGGTGDTNWVDTNSDGTPDNITLNSTPTLTILDDAEGRRLKTDSTIVYAGIFIGGFNATKMYKCIIKYRGTANIRFQSEDGLSIILDTIATWKTETIYIKPYGGAALMQFLEAGYVEFDYIEFQEATPITLTAMLGTKSVTSSALSIVAGTFTKFVLNFEATAAEVNQDLKAYLSGAGSVHVDNLSLTQAYDLLRIYKFNIADVGTTGSNIIFVHGGVGTVGAGGLQTYYNKVDNRLIVGGQSTDYTYSASVNSSYQIARNTFVNICDSVNRTGNLSIYVDAALGNTMSMLPFGKMIQTISSYNMMLGAWNAGQPLKLYGQIAHLQILRFDNIEQSDYNPAVQGMQFPTGGGAEEVLRIDWSNVSGTTVYDSSPRKNNGTWGGDALVISEIQESTLASTEGNGTYIGNWSPSFSFNGVILDNTGLYGYDFGSQVFKINYDGALLAGWNFDSSALWSGVKTTTAGYATNNGDITISSTTGISTKNFYIDLAGNAYFKGDISAASGTFTGNLSIGTGNTIFKADSNGIYLGNATFASAPFSVTPAGVLKATSGTIANWTLSATSLQTGAFDTVSTMYFGTSGLSLSNTFKVTAAGALTATSATITGIITANTGYIGGTTNGWQILAGEIRAIGTGKFTTSSTTTRVEVDSTGLKAYNAGTQRVQILSDGSGWLGNSTDFSWNTSGVLSVNKITATSGSIAGWLIDTTKIYNTNISISNATLAAASGDIILSGGDAKVHVGTGVHLDGATTGVVLLGAATSISAGNGVFIGGDGTFRAGNAAASRLLWDGTNVEIYNSANSKVVSLGGTNTIAGWTIDATQLWTGTLSTTRGFASASSITLSTANSIGISTPAFYADLGGNAGINGTLTVGTGNITLPYFYAGKLRKNLLSYSNTFSNAVYNYQNAAFDGTVTSPEGVQNASKVILSATTWDMYRVIAGLDPAKTYTFSMYVKLGTATNFVVVINNTLSWDVSSIGIFNNTYLSTTEWRRIQVSVTGSATYNIHLGAHGRTIAPNTQESGGSVFFYGSQLEEGSIATGYQATDDISQNILGPNLVLNSFTWDGLGTDVYPAYWYIQIGTSGDASSCSVKTGDGFTGNAVRVVETGTSNRPYFYTNYVNTLYPGRTYRLSLKYRSNTTFGTGNFYGYGVIPINTGNATTFTSDFVVPYAVTYLGFYGAQDLAGSWFEIDEVEVREVLKDYGIWASNGGFGGTVQNPITSITDSGLYIRSRGTTEANATPVHSNGIYIGEYAASYTRKALVLRQLSTDATSGLFYYDGTTEIFALRADGTAKIGNWSITSSSLQTGAFDTASTMYFGSSGISLSNTFKVTAAGALTATSATITGVITATSGTFTGTVNASGGNFTGNVTIGTHTDKITIAATAANTTTAIYAGTGTYGNTDTGFFMDASGRFSLKNKLTWDGSTLTIDGGGTFSGALSAASGSFAGSLSAVTGTLGALTVNGILTLGTGTIASTNFNVTSTGVVTATGATVTGTLNASAGTFSGNILVSGVLQTSATDNTGVKINSTAIAGYNGNVQTVNIATDGSGWFGLTGNRAISWTAAGVATIGGLKASNSALTLGSTDTHGTSTTTVYLGTDGLSLTDKFWVNTNGDLTATSATITGAIYATSGKFGTATNHWLVGATGLTAVAASTDVKISYGKTDFGQTTTTGFILGYDYSASKPKFEIGSSATAQLVFDGTDLSISGAITATSGAIGGWSILSSAIQDNTTYLNSKTFIQKTPYYWDLNQTYLDDRKTPLISWGPAQTYTFDDDPPYGWDLTGGTDIDSNWIRYNTTGDTAVSPTIDATENTAYVLLFNALFSTFEDEFYIDIDYYNVSSVLISSDSFTIASFSKLAVQYEKELLTPAYTTYFVVTVTCSDYTTLTYLKAFSVSKLSSLVEISSKGILVWSGNNTYFKAGEGTFTLKGGTVDVPFLTATEINASSKLTTQMLTVNTKMYFGTAKDTNLYRYAANTLKTDDALVVTGSLTTAGFPLCRWRGSNLATPPSTNLLGGDIYINDAGRVYIYDDYQSSWTLMT
jgi:hypothetical protein